MFNEKRQLALSLAKSLFDRGKATGSTANVSFLHNKQIYISASGASFFNLTTDQLICLGQQSNYSPSKEFPLHQICYEAHPDARAVFHVHSFYATLWSCLEHDDPHDVIPAYTPYLQMKAGSVAIVPYAPPGSKQLFNLFRTQVANGKAFLLQHHGAVAIGSSLTEAFNIIEELEESARIAWYFRNETIPTIY